MGILSLAKNSSNPEQWVWDRYRHHLAKRIAAGTDVATAEALELEELRKDRQALFDYDPSRAPNCDTLAKYDAVIAALTK